MSTKEKLYDEIFDLADKAESYYIEDDFALAVIETTYTRGKPDGYKCLEFFTDVKGEDLLSLQAGYSYLPFNKPSGHKVNKRQFMTLLINSLDIITQKYDR